MFNGENIVATEHSKGGYKLLPPIRTMPLAAGMEDPASVAFVSVRLYVENASIDTLPEHMARIVIAPNIRASNRSQTQHCLRIVGDKSWMHLDRRICSMIACELCMHPVCRHDFLHPTQRITYEQPTNGYIGCLV